MPNISKANFDAYLNQTWTFNRIVMLGEMLLWIDVSLILLTCECILAS